MQFIYFVENTVTVTKEVLDRCGLSYVLDDDAELSQRDVDNFVPCGKKGVLFTTGSADQCSYKPDSQIWQLANNKKFWLGCLAKQMPRPADLARPVQLAGHNVLLEDNNKWLIPVARQIIGGSALPKSLVLGSAGEVIEKQLPRYACFWNSVEKLWNDFLVINKLEPDGKLMLSMSHRIEIAAEAIGFNYRVGIDEINMLSLLTTSNMSKIEAAILDIETAFKIIKEMNKKKESRTKNGSDSACGKKV